MSIITYESYNIFFILVSTHLNLFQSPFIPIFSNIDLMAITIQTCIVRFIENHLQTVAHPGQAVLVAYYQ